MFKVNRCELIAAYLRRAFSSALSSFFFAILGGLMSSFPIFSHGAVIIRRESRAGRLLLRMLRREEEAINSSMESRTVDADWADKRHLTCGATFQRENSFFRQQRTIK